MNNLIDPALPCTEVEQLFRVMRKDAARWAKQVKVVSVSSDGPATTRLDGWFL